MDWSDVPHLLALSRGGTLAAAARATGTDATTVRRRIDALEAGLGARLVVRAPGGWRLTRAGEAAIAAAQRAEAAMADLQRAAAGTATEVRGLVRLTTVSVLASRLVAPVLPRLHARHPDLEIELITSTRVLDLQAGEADVGLRTVRPTRAGVRHRRLATFSARPYVGESFLRDRGLEPGEITSLDGLPVVLLMGPGDGRWIEGAGDARVVLRTTSPEAAHQAIRRGLGVGVVADVVGERDHRLVALPGLPVAGHRDLWLACPEDLADVARVRAVMDFLAEVLPERARGR
jgi:DNA-binding transcriptional LysR family regulator